MQIINAIKNYFTTRNSNNEKNNVIIRESLKIKSIQASSAFIGVGITILVLLITMQDDSTIGWVLFWVLPIFFGLYYRKKQSKLILAELPEMNSEKICEYNHKLKINSIILQFLVGTGIWSIGLTSDEITAFYVTLIIGIYGLGSMINLASDFRAYYITMPLLMIHPIVFWMFHDNDRIGVAIALLILSTLMLSAARRSYITFIESVDMRFEKNVLLDLVEREKARVEQALQVAQNANRSKAFFMATASHDLRQPLYAISILNDTLLMEELADSSLKILKKQAQAIGQLTESFDDLLDLSKFESDQIVPTIRVFDIAEILQPISQEYYARCKEKDLKWQIFIATNAYVKSDAELLKRLFRNLLSNAIKYTHEGSVILSVRKHENGLKVIIEDTGPGIKLEDQTKIFDEYIQLDNPHRNSKNGVGLGLAIVAHINKVLKIKLSLSSIVDSGTKFSFNLPTGEKSEMKLVSTHNFVSPKIDLDGIVIWIAEDDPLIKSAMSVQFDMWRCKYRFFLDKNSILKALYSDQQQADVYILDDMLNATNTGLEIATILSKTIPSNKIMLMSGNSDIERLQELKNSPFNFMQKPIPGNQLISWIEGALKKELEIS